MCDGGGGSAEELIETAHDLRRVDTTPYLRAHLVRFEARLAARRGDDQAESGFARAEEAFREQGAPFGLGLTLLGQGEWLAECARPDEAATAWDEAGGIFDALGAAPWRERLDRAVGVARLPLVQPSA